MGDLEQLLYLAIGAAVVIALLFYMLNWGKRTPKVEFPPQIIQEAAMNTEKEIIKSVKVIDIEMPFFSMMGFMIKWSLAAIPAMIILIFIGAIVVGTLGQLGSGNL